ncbi:MAG: hypothetical protein MR018_01565 [Clostridiales bacterium]|nr:hypothetical protein [Clostridiales bacterium]
MIRRIWQFPFFDINIVFIDIRKLIMGKNRKKAWKTATNPAVSSEFVRSAWKIIQKKRHLRNRFRQKTAAGNRFPPQHTRSISPNAPTIGYPPTQTRSLSANLPPTRKKHPAGLTLRGASQFTVSAFRKLTCTGSR